MSSAWPVVRPGSFSSLQAQTVAHAEEEGIVLEGLGATMANRIFLSVFNINEIVRARS